MKQVSQNFKTGSLALELVPTPTLRPGGLLVRTSASLISAGTEKTKVDTAKMSLLAKVRSRPDQVRKVLETLKKEGYANTYRKVRGKLDALAPLGYSLAGVVIGVGPGVTEFRVGDRVACAGAGYANHAEVVFVPKHLCAKIPDGVSDEEASFATVGAIALHGVRQADVRLGERVGVIGLGLIGQLTVQLLKAAGCVVLGIDIDNYAIEKARQSGAAHLGVPGRDDLEAMAASISDGHGLDAVIITAGTKSNAPIELAPRLMRDRGRVVVVGAVQMNLEREPFFTKEIDLRLSRSYGPGRYDVNYEEHGRDYPIGYVRWTENRNLSEFLGLIARKGIALANLTTHRFKFEEASQAYALIAGTRREGYLGIVLGYDQTRVLEDVITLPQGKAAQAGELGVGVIGAGSFAKGTILPRLKSEPGLKFRGIQTASGLTATDVGTKQGFAFAASTPDAVVQDPQTQLVFVMTRHDLHAEQVLSVLEAGKTVFVEKPLAINPAELDAIVANQRSRPGAIMVGFNRRFSPAAQAVRQFFAGSHASLAIAIRINAGAIPRDHWIQDPAIGGGRIIGEVCHFVDLAQFLAGARIVRAFADCALEEGTGRVIEDVVAIHLRHANGTVSQIAYVSNGDTSFPKERVEVFGGGNVGLIEDFVQTTLVTGGRAKTHKTVGQDKGHTEELRRFLASAKAGGPMPIAFDDLVNTTRATFAIMDSIRTGLPVEVQT